MALNYVFGPVASGRLGRSLGLDLVGEPVCSYDCLYCESGRTSVHTMERAPYVAAEELRRELGQWLAVNGGGPDDADAGSVDLDHITLGGVGEPTLNSEMPRVLRMVREAAPDVASAVLTNGTTCVMPEVRRELTLADAVLPSMDTLVEAEWRKLNRPAPQLAALTALDVAEGLLRLREEFAGRLYLEVLLVRGVNDSERNLELMADFCARLRPDRVDVATMTRPGAYLHAPAPAPTIEAWRAALAPLAAGSAAGQAHGPDAVSGSVSGSLANGAAGMPASSGTAEAIQSGRGARATRDHDPETTRDMILASLRRRPQTAAQLAAALGLQPENVDSGLETLRKQGHIRHYISVDEKNKASSGAVGERFYMVVGGANFT